MPLLRSFAELHHDTADTTAHPAKHMPAGNRHSHKPASTAMPPRPPLPTCAADGLRILFVVKLGGVDAHHSEGRPRVLALYGRQVGQHVDAIDAAAEGGTRRQGQSNSQGGQISDREAQGGGAAPLSPTRPPARLPAHPSARPPTHPPVGPKVEHHHLAAQLPPHPQRGSGVEPVEPRRELWHSLARATSLHVCKQSRAGRQE